MLKSSFLKNLCLIFFYTLFSEPSDIQKCFLFNLFSNLLPKKIAIFMNKICFFIFVPPSSTSSSLCSRYGAPKQAKHEKICI
jgi:hypothetical protein